MSLISTTYSLSHEKSKYTFKDVVNNNTVVVKYFYLSPDKQYIQINRDENLVFKTTDLDSVSYGDVEIVIEDPLTGSTINAITISYSGQVYPSLLLHCCCDFWFIIINCIRDIIIPMETRKRTHTHNISIKPTSFIKTVYKFLSSSSSKKNNV